MRTTAAVILGGAGGGFAAISADFSKGFGIVSCLSDSTKRLGVSLKEKEKRSRIAQRGKSNQMFEKVKISF